MKLLTLNFLTCARKGCKSTAAAFPLHPKEAELEQIEIELNPLFITNMLPRLDWEAMKTLTQEVKPFVTLVGNLTKPSLRLTINSSDCPIFQLKLLQQKKCRRKKESQHRR